LLDKKRGEEDATFTVIIKDGTFFLLIFPMNLALNSLQLVQCFIVSMLPGSAKP
jgi:hypothetical protein